MLSITTFALASTSSSLVCSDVKSLYTESQCCSASPNTEITACKPKIPNFGFPHCYATYKDLSKAYAHHEQHNYLPSNDGYVYLPFSGAKVSDCLNIPRPVIQHVAHASPLGMTILDSSKDSIKDSPEVYCKDSFFGIHSHVVLSLKQSVEVT